MTDELTSAGTVVAVDVGGTFSDVVVLNPTSGKVAFAKSPTTPAAPSEGVLTALSKAAPRLDEIEVFLHGTTLGLNAMLERKGSRTGLLTTLGFRDVLELRRMDWPEYRLHWQAPAPLVPRYLRREVPERMLADGTVHRALDEPALRREVDRLVDEGIDSLAICFMHAYANPAHELRAREIVAADHRGLAVTISHEVTREYREYERTSTTVVDAAIKPLIAGYIDQLESSLRMASFRGSFVLTRCDGGVMSANEARQRPIRTFVSGPASGVMGVVTLSRWLGLPNVIACDMGGTSFDASIVIGNEPSLAARTTVGDVPLLVPVVEIATIGAGGGSIAWLDAGGALEVGPQSAGAQPGPACYGNGGSEPTFTDAALVSGLLDSDRFLGGEMRLDVEAAREAVEEVVARPLGLSIEEAAAGIVALSEAKMAATLEELTIEKGRDPREFTLLAYGGGGPLVASSLASRLGIPRVVVPPSPGTFSAWGMLTLDFVHDFSRTAVAALDTLTPAVVGDRFSELEASAHAALDREQIPTEHRTLQRFVDMRYEAQEHVLTIPVDLSPGAAIDLDVLRERFDQSHQRAYGYAMADPVELTTYRIRASGTRDKPAPQTSTRTGVDVATARVGMRKALHRESGGMCEWTIYDRSLLEPGHRIEGPAIIEEMASTALVGPHQQVEVDELGNLVITSVPAKSKTAVAAARPNGKVDPITFAVVRNALIAANRVAVTAIRRTAMLPLIYEMFDFAVSLFDPDVNLLADAPVLPIFSGSLGVVVPPMIATVGADNIRPGDIVVTNHPHLNGSHPPDGVLVTPVYADDRLFGYFAARAHMGDTGGSSIFPTDTSEVIQEGLLLPPLKLYDEGLLDTKIVEIIKANSRTPEVTVGDFLATAAAVRAGAAAVESVIAKYGSQTYNAVTAGMLEHGESVARKGVARIPDGVYTAEGALDDNGVDAGVPVPLKVTITVDADHMTVDTSGSAPQQAAPVNCPTAYTTAVARMALKTLANPDFPSNGGEHRVLSLIAPEGSIFNPGPAAASFLSSAPALQLCELILLALAPALPDEIPAMSGADLAATNALLLHPRTGRWVFTAFVNGVGHGAMRGADGTSALYHRASSGLQLAPLEVLEARCPTIRIRCQLDADSGGPGCWRGGLGVTEESEFTAAGLGGMIADLTSGVVPIAGLAGGWPSPRQNGVVFFPGTDREVGPPRCKRTRLPIAPGDRYVSFSAGGGGYGDPLDRDPTAVAWDVKNDYVSTVSAADDYGVVLDVNGAPLSEATAERRSELKERRATTGPRAKARIG